VIVVDSSALMAVIGHEVRSDAVSACLLGQGRFLMSAGTLVECHVVSTYRRVHAGMMALIDSFEIEIVPFDAEMAAACGRAYRTWGKGVHPAGLNFGDCFAYALAKSRDLPLLYVGGDFALTDIRAAIPAE
jgi:ribonuclease VapC